MPVRSIYYGVAMAPGRRLSLHICGSVGSPEHDPLLIVGEERAVDLVYALNERPMSVEELCSVLGIDRERVVGLLNAWARVNAVRVQPDGRYRVNFAIFTRSDIYALDGISDRVAAQLVERIGSIYGDIVSMAGRLSSARQVAIDKLLFAVIGSYSLDLSCLGALEERGLIVRTKDQPGGGRYLLFAREELGEEEKTRIYDMMFWGTHHERLNRYSFISFGDSTGYRYAFPDILWLLIESSHMGLRGSGAPEWVLKKALSLTLIKALYIPALEEIASLLLKVNEQPLGAENIYKDWPRDAVELLEDMGYITRSENMFRLSYPVFTIEDRDIVEEIASRIAPIAVDTFEQSHQTLLRDLSGISPLRNEIPVEEVMNEVWHWIFAKTNRELAMRGMIYNPPRRRHREARYIAWVSEFSWG